MANMDFLKQALGALNTAGKDTITSAGEYINPRLDAEYNRISDSLGRSMNEIGGYIRGFGNFLNRGFGNSPRQSMVTPQPNAPMSTLDQAMQSVGLPSPSAPVAPQATVKVMPPAAPQNVAQNVMEGNTDNVNMGLMLNKLIGGAGRLNAEGIGQMQDALNRMGYMDSSGNALSVDGMMGGKTESAIRNYLKDNPLNLQGDNPFFEQASNFQGPMFSPYN
tara:strand:+ start:29 stop:688 length:660 start_codon:yes stop_codon:yes gene_type:complete